MQHIVRNCLAIKSDIQALKVRSPAKNRLGRLSKDIFLFIFAMLNTPAQIALLRCTFAWSMWFQTDERVARILVRTAYGQWTMRHTVELGLPLSAPWTRRWRDRTTIHRNFLENKYIVRRTPLLINRRMRIIGHEIISIIDQKQEDGGGWLVSTLDLFDTPDTALENKQQPKFEQINISGSGQVLWWSVSGVELMAINLQTLITHQKVDIRWHLLHPNMKRAEDALIFIDSCQDLIAYICQDDTSRIRIWDADGNCFSAAVQGHNKMLLNNGKLLEWRVSSLVTTNVRTGASSAFVLTPENALDKWKAIIITEPRLIACLTDKTLLFARDGLDIRLLDVLPGELVRSDTMNLEFVVCVHRKLEKDHWFVRPWDTKFQKLNVPCPFAGIGERSPQVVRHSRFTPLTSQEIIDWFAASSNMDNRQTSNKRQRIE